MRALPTDSCTLNIYLNNCCRISTAMQIQDIGDSLLTSNNWQASRIDKACNIHKSISNSIQRITRADVFFMQELRDLNL